MRRTLVPVLAGSLVLALAGAPRAADAQASYTARIASARAVAWIAAQQQTDGGFELAAFPGFETPDAVLAIAESAQVSDTWDTTRARNAVTGIVRGSHNPLHNLDDLVDAGTSGGQAAKLIVLDVAPLGLDPRDFDPQNDSAAAVDLVATMDAAKLPDGSYGAGVFNATLYAAIANKLVGRTVPADTIAYITAAQQANGSWNYTGTAAGTGIDVDTSALAMMALSAAGKTGTDAAMKKAMTMLATAQFSTGGWGDDYGSGPEVNTNSTAMAAIAIKAAGANPNLRTWRDTAAPARTGEAYVTPEATLLARQQANGHFSSPFDGYGLNTFATSQSVQGLLLSWLPIATSPTTPPPSGDAVAVSITGGLSTSVSGPLTSGNLTLSRDQFGAASVDGTGAVGATTVTFALKRFWILQLYLGSVRVSGVSGDVAVQVFFGNGSYDAGTKTAQGSGPWLRLTSFPWKSGQITWSVTDAG